MKLLLVINVEDDVADAYKDFTVDYDLRGIPKEDPKVNESIKYVEDCPLKPLPKKKEMLLADKALTSYMEGWNDCLDELDKNCFK